MTLRKPGTGNPGPPFPSDFTDTLPAQLVLTSATASSGIVSTSGNTVTWTGPVAGLGSVIITINAAINAGTAGQLVSNQGTLLFDSDGNDTNDAQILTDDPGVAGPANPTVFQVGTGPVSFYTLTPCRVIDTRNHNSPLGGPALAAQADRIFSLWGPCTIPSTAKALAVTLTVTGATQLGHLRFHPVGLLGTTSVINFANQTRGNNAIVALDSQGRVAVFCGQASGTVHFILDVSGYFEWPIEGYNETDDGQSSQSSQPDWGPDSPGRTSGPRRRIDGVLPRRCHRQRPRRDQPRGPSGRTT